MQNKQNSIPHHSYNHSEVKHEKELYHKVGFARVAVMGMPAQ